MSDRGLVVPVDGRRMISTGVGITLVVAGAIVRFAVPAMVARTSRQRDVRRSRDRESALRESEHRAAHRVL